MYLFEFILLIVAIIFIAVVIISSVLKRNSAKFEPAPQCAGSVELHGAGWFTSAVISLRLDGTEVIETRRTRKGPGPQFIQMSGATPLEHISPWLRFWAPHRITWWIAVLFIIGSLLFTLGGAFGLFPEFFGLKSHTGNALTVSGTYFAGSIFYSVAAYLSILEHLNADKSQGLRAEDNTLESFRWWGWEPHRIGFLASFIQLAGAFFFQINAFYALMPGLGLSDRVLLVTAPSLDGSICFLIASYMGFAEVVHGYFGWRPRSIPWWLTLCNTTGSVAFVLGAACGYFGPGVPEPISPFLNHLFFFIGSAFFIVGSYLMLPEMFSEETTEVPAYAMA